jgi:hypothetical protein
MVRQNAEGRIVIRFTLLCAVCAWLLLFTFNVLTSALIYDCPECAAGTLFVQIAKPWAAFPIVGSIVGDIWHKEFPHPPKCDDPNAPNSSTFDCE